MWRHPRVCLWIETPKTPVWRHPTLKRKSRQGNNPSRHWGRWIKASTSLVTTGSITLATFPFLHDDVIKWKHFPRYCPFVLGIHRSPVNSPHKGQRRGALIFSLIWASINGWVNNREAGDLRRNRPHYDVTVMCVCVKCTFPLQRQLFWRTRSLLSWWWWVVTSWCMACSPCYYCRH